MAVEVETARTVGVGVGMMTNVGETEISRWQPADKAAPRKTAAHMRFTIGKPSHTQILASAENYITRPKEAVRVTRKDR